MSGLPSEITETYLYWLAQTNLRFEGGRFLKQKNLIAAVFAAALVLQTQAAAAEFSDFPTDWSAAALTRAVNDGLLSGANGKINPS